MSRTLKRKPGELARSQPHYGATPEPWTFTPTTLREQLRKTWNETAAASIARAMGHKPKGRG